jgi:hypothetical protein
VVRYEHQHTGLNLHTPTSVHYVEVGEIVRRRKNVMDEAFARTPSRFSNGRPVVLANPAVVAETGHAKDLLVAENREAIYTI